MKTKEVKKPEPAPTLETVKVEKRPETELCHRMLVQNMKGIKAGDVVMIGTPQFYVPV